MHYGQVFSFLTNTVHQGKHVRQGRRHGQVTERTTRPHRPQGQLTMVPCSLTTFQIWPLTDHNEITHHLLHIVQSHLVATKGLLDVMCRHLALLTVSQRMESATKGAGALGAGVSAPSHGDYGTGGMVYCDDF